MSNEETTIKAVPNTIDTIGVQYEAVTSQYFNRTTYSLCPRLWRNYNIFINQFSGKQVEFDAVTLFSNPV